MTSQIDPTVPAYQRPYTDTVRRNFAIARTEISELQDRVAAFLPLAGGELTGDLTIRRPNEPAIILREDTRQPTEGRRWSMSVINGNFGVDLDTSGDWSDYQTLFYLRWDDRSVRFAGNVAIEAGLTEDVFLSLRSLRLQPDEGGEWRWTIGSGGNLRLNTGDNGIARFWWADGKTELFYDVEVHGELTAGNFPRLANLEARVAALEGISPVTDICAPDGELIGTDIWSWGEISDFPPAHYVLLNGAMVGTPPGAGTQLTRDSTGNIFVLASGAWYQWDGSDWVPGAQPDPVPPPCPATLPADPELPEQTKGETS